MSVAIIQHKLLAYQPQTLLEQQLALKEIAQQIALMALSRAEFFRIADFKGSSCLRIFHQIKRFSDNLNFSLLTPNSDFDWEKYIPLLRDEFHIFGYSLDVTKKKQGDNQLLILITRDAQITLDLHTNPPAGAQHELKYLDFPLAYSIKTQNLPSLFANQCHALFCREDLSGRDWYDFLWYVSHQTPINFTLLTHAISLAGPWQHQQIKATPRGLVYELKKKITRADWDSMKLALRKYLHPRELPSLDLWSQAFFLTRVDKLGKYLNSTSS